MFRRHRNPSRHGLSRRRLRRDSRPARLHHSQRHLHYGLRQHPTIRTLPRPAHDYPPTEISPRRGCRPNDEPNAGGSSPSASAPPSGSARARHSAPAPRRPPLATPQSRSASQNTAQDPALSRHGNTFTKPNHPRSGRQSVQEMQVRNYAPCAPTRQQDDRTPLHHHNESSRHFRLASQVPHCGQTRLCFSTARIAIFIDGCFWHGCPHCYKPPKSNWRFWRAKITAIELATA